MSNKRKNVKIVVLGDIGRSPRMQYHALSLANMGHLVDIIGYGETDPMESIKTEPHIFYHYLLAVPQIRPRILNYIFKTIFQALNLLFLLFFTRTTDILVVQNPPAIPALIICWFYTRIIQAKFLIDWHNYGHSIMALNVGRKNLLTKITEKIEFFIGRRADNNFCVTNAMRDDLKKYHSINALTLYDRPPEIFQTISLEEKHNFYRKLVEEYDMKFIGCDNENTIFTEKINGIVQLRTNRPAILVSCTSWTEDEDFSILLAALQDYENCYQNGNSRQLPRLICFITGKGPLKDYYCEKISQENWKYVHIITPWLKSNDYPLMLASSDLGVSLHTSSSGLDLPMKVVDMFGCGLPVCAHDFNCLSELVRHDENGYKFQSSDELSGLIMNWFEEFPNNEKRNEIEKIFKKELESFQKLRWKENWTNIASPLFE